MQQALCMRWCVCVCVCCDCHKASAYAGNCLCVMEWLRVVNETDEPTQRKRQNESTNRKGGERGRKRVCEIEGRSARWQLVHMEMHR